MKAIFIEESGQSRAVAEAAQVIRQGGVVVCPTDTVYGLLADATNEKAVERVFEIKEREQGKPLSVFVQSIKQARELAHINEEQEEFLVAHWPGKVTAVLEGRHVLGKGVELDGKIGLRIPDYALVNALLAEYGKPLTGTSANISGVGSCGDSRDVISQFQGKPVQPDLLLDAGKLPESAPSSVFDITGEERKTLRA